MYSEELQKVFDENGIDIGQRIRVSNDKGTYEGILMPKPGSGDAECIVLKLDNGYNVGIRYDKRTEVEESNTPEPEEIEREARFEMGTLNHEDHFTFDDSKPPVELIVTGGTISSKVDYETGGVSALIEPQELLHFAPDISDFANVSVSSPFTRMSENMGFREYKKLATAVYESLQDNEGVIITHGTDTLHFTAAALSFALPGLDKPVVLTGAQRSTDRGSTDASLNLTCAAVAATSDIAEVGICMHESLNDDTCLFTRGTKVRKMHTSRRDTFRPINASPLARISPDGEVERLSDHRARGSGNTELDAEFYSKVALVKAYPNARPHVIEHYVDEGYRAIVVEATGLGHVPTRGRDAWLEAIEEAIESGTTVVFAPQTLYGMLNPDVYSNTRKAEELGVLYARDMLPEVAYIKMAWILGHTKSSRKIRDMFYTNYAGEFNERREADSFLY